MDDNETCDLGLVESEALEFAKKYAATLLDDGASFINGREAFENQLANRVQREAERMICKHILGESV